jgi:hypothetical protein
VRPLSQADEKRDSLSPEKISADRETAGRTIGGCQEEQPEIFIQVRPFSPDSKSWKPQKGNKHSHPDTTKV